MDQGREIERERESERERERDDKATWVRECDSRVVVHYVQDRAKLLDV